MVANWMYPFRLFYLLSHETLSLSLILQTHLFSSVILPLKPDLAADLLLPATSSSITLLTCVYTACVCMCVSVSQQDETVLKLKTHSWSIYLMIPGFFYARSACTCICSFIPDHPVLSVHQTDTLGVMLLFMCVTVHLCDVTHWPLSAR